MIFNDIKKISVLVEDIKQLGVSEKERLRNLNSLIEKNTVLLEEATLVSSACKKT